MAKAPSIRDWLRTSTLNRRNPIAAIAMTHDATLLTRNVRDFRKVPDLKLDPWTMVP